jgi:putative MATE family efflux protein
MLVNALYNIVDQIFIGQGVGMLGNAATNVAFPITTICTAISMLLGIGSAVNFNLCLGRGEKEKAGHIAGNGLFLLAVCGTAFGALVLIFLNPILHVFGATDQIFTLARTYTGITAFGIPFLIFSTGGSQLIRADGSPSYSMTCLLTGAILNMILDPIFIFGLEMGIAGAAWATVISQLVTFVLVILYLTKFKTTRLSKQYLRVKAEYTQKIMQLGAAASLSQIAVGVFQIVMNNTLVYYGAQSPYGSEIPLASVGVITKVIIVVIALTVGIAQGCQPIFGFNYGAKNYERVRQTFFIAAIAVVTVSIIAELFFQLLPRQIISIFGGGNEDYFHFAERYFRIFMAMTFINGFHLLIGNFLTAIGKAKKGMLVILTRQFLFLVPLVLILPIFFGIDGVMYAGPIADTTATVLAITLIYREFKEMRQE